MKNIFSVIFMNFWGYDLIIFLAAAFTGFVFYSTKKTFQNYKSIKAEVKDGKAIIRLKKLKKGKTYYIKVQSRVVYNYKERSFVEYSKLTKTKKLKIKK